MQAPDDLRNITATTPVLRPVPIKLPTLLPSPPRAAYQPQVVMVPNRTWSSSFTPASPQVVQLSNVAAMQMQVGLLSQKALSRQLNRDELRQLQLLLFSLSTHNPVFTPTTPTSPGRSSSPSSSSPSSPLTLLPPPLLPAAPRQSISLTPNLLSPVRNVLCAVPPPTTTPATGDIARERKLRVCVHCGTTKSTQWRRGPYKKAKLCNACGLRFSRNFARRMQNKQKEGQSNENKRSSIYDVLN